jgi:ribosomal protein S18 acetylase RimI-like enzyme
MIESFRRIDGAPLVVERSDVESRRFGLSVARLNVPLASSVQDDEIVRVCKENIHDVVVVRYPTDRARVAELFARCDDVISFQVDTLVYFSLKVSSRPTLILPSTDYPIRPATVADREDLSALFGASFTNYTSHYAANPIFKEQDIRDGYIEWATSYLEQASFETLLARTESDALSGFITMKIDPDVAELILSGVHPTYHGQGIYTSLVDHALNVGQLHGVDEVVTSTQVSNFRVIRTWIRAGFTLECSLNTIHFMRR